VTDCADKITFMNGGRPTTSWQAEMIACPECDARLPFCRSRTPDIDGCGFESYSLECKECKATLAGIIDPKTEELLLTKSAYEGVSGQHR